MKSGCAGRSLWVGGEASAHEWRNGGVGGRVTGGGEEVRMDRRQDFGWVVWMDDEGRAGGRVRVSERVSE